MAKLDVRQIPAAMGFRMPAEWASHHATWIAWPHEKTDWPGKFSPIKWVYGSIVRHLSQVEKVRILVEDTEAEQTARKVLKKSGALLENVEFFPIKTDRSWTRDYCPIFVKNAAGSAEPSIGALTVGRNTAIQKPTTR